MNAQTVAEATSLCMEFGGRSRLSCFDSFHVATDKSLGFGFLTSDGFILRNASKLGIKVVDLVTWKLTEMDDAGVLGM